ncbi:MAG TPA: hypothetical protein VFQ43_19385, partial [Nitrososphaera sp.]|nr:hypothetical protein [Nitrososphaera sp.]
PPQKVLTAAQFQILKKHEDLDNRQKVGRATDSDDEYEDDEDDEATQAQKRKLQEHKEAQHKIWRQRMSKAIGDQSSPLPTRASFQRSGQNTPSFLFDNSFATSEAGGSGGSSDDEDIPLAVLQAHGFPSKTNTPDPRHSAHSYLGLSRPLSSVGSLPRPGSPGGARSVAGGPRGSLPPFARKLPQDPYLGSSDLVNREAPGFNNQRPTSVYTPVAGSPMPNIPNGLVGVIAEEERQRSMRRGSPNQPGLRQSAYLPPPAPAIVPGMPLIGMPAVPMGPGMMPMIGAGQAGLGSEQQQQQLNQQMFQLLQQQSAMLQQLMTQGGTPNVQQPLSFANTPISPQARPMSLAAANVRQRESRTMSMVNLAPPMQPRTMSMINIPQPNMGGNFGMEGLMSGAASVRGLGLHDNHYAPSVAPSERSNIGQPSRYKPVQSSNLADTDSTITATKTIQPSKAEKKRSFLSAIIHPSNKGRTKENAVVDEDEEDWSSFAMKRRGHA